LLQPSVIAAAISFEVLLLFFVRPGRPSVIVLFATQAASALLSFAFALLIDAWWIVLAGLAIPGAAMLYLTERRAIHPISRHPN